MWFGPLVISSRRLYTIRDMAIYKQLDMRQKAFLEAGQSHSGFCESASCVTPCLPAANGTVTRSEVVMETAETAVIVCVGTGGVLCSSWCRGGERFTIDDGGIERGEVAGMWGMQRGGRRWRRRRRRREWRCRCCCGGGEVLLWRGGDRPCRHHGPRNNSTQPILQCIPQDSTQKQKQKQKLDAASPSAIDPSFA